MSSDVATIEVEHVVELVVVKVDWNLILAELASPYHEVLTRHLR